jgi:hypothetical protein
VKSVIETDEIHLKFKRNPFAGPVCWRVVNISTFIKKQAAALDVLG